MRLISLVLSLYTLVVAIYLLGKMFDYPLLKKAQPIVAPLVEPVLALVRRLLEKVVPEKVQRMDWPPYTLLILLLLLNIIL